MQSEGWLTVLGKGDLALEERLQSRAAKALTAAVFTKDNVSYIERLDLMPVKDRLEMTEERLELLRNVCKSWYVELKPRQISSHRRFIGPVIVAAKSALFRILTVLLKDYIQEQRRFHSAVVALLAEVAREVPATGQAPRSKGS